MPNNVDPIYCWALFIAFHMGLRIFSGTYYFDSLICEQAQGSPLDRAAFKAQEGDTASSTVDMRRNQEQNPGLSVIIPPFSLLDCHLIF